MIFVTSILNSQMLEQIGILICLKNTKENCYNLKCVFIILLLFFLSYLRIFFSPLLSKISLIFFKLFYYALQFLKKILFSCFFEYLSNYANKNAFYCHNCHDNIVIVWFFDWYYKHTAWEPSVGKGKKVDVSSTFIENIFQSGLTLVSSCKDCFCHKD